MRRTNKPVVKNEVLLGEADAIHTAGSIPVGSGSWFAWLANHNGFVYEGNIGHFTARSELRRGIRYWYGHRRREGKLSKIYLGKSEDLTQERLEQASAILSGKLSKNNTAGDIGSLLDQSKVIAAAEVSHLPLSKFKPPALPQRLITRPRLVKRFNAPITLISAPSGFGKTTLVNEWRQSSGIPVVWVNLNAEDNQPQRFWSAVGMAFQTIYPNFGQEWLSGLHSSSPPSLRKTVIDLTNDIVRVMDETNKDGLCLVLDDFHHIQQTEIHSSLQTWLEQIPPKFHLIVTSNFKLPITLGYLRTKGVVAEVKADELRFTQEEGVDYLKQCFPDQPLAFDDLQTLIRRTEGWAAGLVLATSVLSQQGNHSRVLEMFTGSHVFLREFFMESILRQQCLEVKNFLLKTSILKYLTGPLCNSLTGRSDSEDMLPRLWEESLFLERLDEPGRYRYHEMFAEMLQTQLREQFPGEVRQLHRKAARWFRAQASPVEAIDHYLLSKYWEDAATLIETVALSELDQHGEGYRLLRWLQQLPEEVIQQHKTLFMLYIRLARLALHPKEVEEILSRTESRIASLPASQKTDALQEIFAEIHHIRHSWSTEAPLLLGTRTSQEDTVSHILDGILQFQRQTRFDLVKAEAKADEVYEAARARNSLFSILMAGGTRANLAYSQGRLRHTEQIAHQVLRQANEMQEKLPRPAGITLTALSGISFERNQITQAHHLLERAMEVDPEPISVDESINRAIQLAKIQSMREDNETALNTIETAREMNARHSSNIWLDQDLKAYQALFRVHQGDVTAAEQLLGEGWEIDQHPFSAFVRASILEIQNRNVAAEEILRFLLARHPSGFYWVPSLRVQVKLACVLFNQQRMNQARQMMAEAARMAAPEFFVRPFITPGTTVSKLLSLVLNTEILNLGTRAFIKGTLAMTGQSDWGQTPSGLENPVTLAIAASITPREQEILRSLSAGLSNREIADRYSISASTVKTHLENIFRKLGVNSRTQAIAQAQTFNLV